MWLSFCVASWVASSCSSAADAVVVEVSLVSLSVLVIDMVVSTADWVAPSISAIWAEISSVALAV